MIIHIGVLLEQIQLIPVGSSDDGKYIKAVISYQDAEGFNETVTTSTSTIPNPKIRVDAKRVGNETTNSPVVFIFSRTGTSSSKTHLGGSIEINYELFGTAQKGIDYTDKKQEK